MSQRCKECQFEEGKHSFECSQYEEQIDYPEGDEEEGVEFDIPSPLDADDVFGDDDAEDDEEEDDEDLDEESGAGRGVRPRI